MGTGVFRPTDQDFGIDALIGTRDASRKAVLFPTSGLPVLNSHPNAGAPRRVTFHLACGPQPSTKTNRPKSNEFVE